MGISHAELTTILEACGKAHHEAFADSDGADPDWSIWYAGWMQAHVGDRMGSYWSRSEWTYRLEKAAREHEGNKTPWPEAYARALLA